MDGMTGIGIIGEVALLQAAVNDEWARLTPEERVAAARAQLGYIASVEADHDS